MAEKKNRCTFALDYVQLCCDSATTFFVPIFVYLLISVCKSSGISWKFQRLPHFKYKNYWKLTEIKRNLQKNETNRSY